MCEGLAKQIIDIDGMIDAKYAYSTSVDGDDQADSAKVVALACASLRVSARGVRHAATPLKGKRRGWVSVLQRKCAECVTFWVLLRTMTSGVAQCVQ